MTPAPKSARQTTRRKSRPAISGPTRERIIDTAGRIFAERGYRAATIREICDAAGENIAAINYHFGDKLGLYTEVVHQSVQAAQITAVANALNQSAPPDQILRAVIRARLNSICRSDRPDWHFRILASELAQPSPVLPQIIEKIGRPIFSRLLELIGSMIGRPASDDKTRLCTISVMGQIMVYVFASPLLASIWPGLKMTPSQIDCIAEHIGDFSLAYIQSFRATSSTATSALIVR